MRSSPALAAGLAAGALVLVVGAGAWWSTSSTESAIQARSQEVLAASGLDAVKVRADGRDIVITDAAGAADRARSALEQVPGAREIVMAGTNPEHDASSTATLAGSEPSAPASPESPASPTASSAPAPPTTSTPATPPGGGVGAAPVTPMSAPATAIRFEKGSSDLDQTARAEVQRIIDYLKQYQGVSVTLIGRTSDEGPADVSLDLSAQRAQRVGEALVAAGISPSRVSTAGAGGMAVDSQTMASLLRRVDVVYEER